MSPTSEVIRQAIEWHQRLHQGGMDEAARRSFKLWMQSPANAKELARIVSIDVLAGNSVTRRGRSPGRRGMSLAD